MKTLKVFTKSVLIFFIIGLILSCQKSNISEYPDFVGTWKASTSNVSYEIIVKENGKATYEEKTNNKEVFYKGKLNVGSSEVIIGLKKFTLDEYPQFESGKWSMKLNSLVYVRD